MRFAESERLNSGRQAVPLLPNWLQLRHAPAGYWTNGEVLSYTSSSISSQLITPTDNPELIYTDRDTGPTC